MTNVVRIGTRGSKLALWQAHYVADLLREAAPENNYEVVVIKTKGDKILDVPLASIGDKGLFTKELESCLLDGSVDMCVHSCKDMPTASPEGLRLAAMPPRANPQDCIVAPQAGMTVESIPAGARVATGSLRRVAQLARLRPDVELCNIRGNVDTRIGKVVSGEFDCAILAAAGIQRLGLDEHISSIIPAETMIPAVGQGAVVVQIREGDALAESLCSAIADTATMHAVQAERIVLAELEGGCQVPMGAYAQLVDAGAEAGAGAGEGTETGAGVGAEAGTDADADAEGHMSLDAFVASLDGSRMVKTHVEGPRSSWEQLAYEAVENLRTQGAQAILEDIR